MESVCSERERLLLEARNAVNDHCRLANAAATLTDPRGIEKHTKEWRLRQRLRLQRLFWRGRRMRNTSSSIVARIEHLVVAKRYFARSLAAVFPSVLRIAMARISEYFLLKSQFCF